MAELERTTTTNPNPLNPKPQTLPQPLSSDRAGWRFGKFLRKVDRTMESLPLSPLCVAHLSSMADKVQGVSKRSQLVEDAMVDDGPLVLSRSWVILRILCKPYGLNPKPS